MSKPSVHVAIAMLFHRGKVLVGWRNADQHQGNKYEFPGGKVEDGENPEQACRREVLEEVGIDISNWHVFDFIRHEYEDIEVNLHLFHAQVSDLALVNIQQPWTWYRREQLLDLNFPKANQAILQRLLWAHQIQISDQLEKVQHLASDKFFYFRTEANEQAQQQIEQLDEQVLSKLIVNVDLWHLLASATQQKVAAVHFKHSQLMAMEKGQLPIGLRCLGACHDLASLQKAQSLGFDAVNLSPIRQTATHSDAIALGWERFAEYAKVCDIPIFALGGLSPDDLQLAQQHGAYGVAGIQNF